MVITKDAGSRIVIAMKPITIAVVGLLVIGLLLVAVACKTPGMLL